MALLKALGCTLLWITALGIAQAAPEVAPRALPPAPGEVRGAWIHTYNPTDWDTVMRRLSQAGFNSIFVRVGRGGNVIYPSTLLPRDAWAQSAGGDELQRAIEAAHRHGLDFHAWRVCFHMRSAPKNYYQRLAGEGRLVRDANGKESFWANPGDTRNTDLEYQAVMEITRKYPVDGIHLDYIRYPDDPHYDFDYSPVSRAAFEKSLGRKVSNWPKDVVSGPLKRAYEDWERENINRLMERIYRGVKQAKPNVQVSAAVWRNHRRYRAAIKQDWPLWVERGWLDFVVPMDYTADDAVFAETVKAQVALTAGRMPMVAGIGTWLQPSADDVATQVAIARRAGASGHVLFAYNDQRINEILEVLAAGAHRQPAVPAYAAPAIRFALPDAVSRKDAPHAVAADASFTVEARLPKATGKEKAPKEFTVCLEDPDGVVAATLGRLTPQQPTLKATATLRPGQFQVVARGGTGAGQQVVRGPLVESLPAAVVAALRAREEPPQVTGDGPRIGIYHDGLGADGIIAALKAAGLDGAVPLYHLRPDHLTVLDAVVLPQLRDVADLSAAAEQALRQWVREGGTLLLTHDAVGFRWHPAPFPEVGQGVALVKRQPLRVRLPGQEEQPLQYAYSDHVRLAPAAEAQVIARETGNGAAPVIVAGRFGKGRVVLMGILPGVAGDGTLKPDEQRLLHALLAPAAPTPETSDAAAAPDVRPATPTAAPPAQPWRAFRGTLGRFTAGLRHAVKHLVVSRG